MAYVARAKADGYTLGLGTIGTQSINPFLYANMTFDPARDFVPIALVSTTPNVIAVSARSPYRTVADIIQAARQNPERKLTYASPGVGSSVHLTGAYFEAMAGISMLHVPFKGTSASLPAVAGGQVDLLFDNLPGALAQIQDGGLVRGVAVTSAARDPSAPALPTVAESGLPGFDVIAWFALYAPRGTPEPVVRQLIEAAREGCARLIWPRASPRRAPSPARCSARNWPRSSRTSGANGAGWSGQGHHRAMKNGTVLVTGGSRGIGRAIVARLIEDGYEAVNFSRGAPESLLPGETFRSVDLADARAAGEAARELAASRPVLHLVNNAGMIEVAGIEAVTQDALARTMAVNLVAPVVLLQALLPGMRAARHGRVVNIGSRAALGKPGRTAYGASKGALAAMTRTWALELAADGITVNTVAPGPVATELFNASNPRRSAHARAGGRDPGGPQRLAGRGGARGGHVHGPARRLRDRAADPCVRRGVGGAG